VVLTSSLLVGISQMFRYGAVAGADHPWSRRCSWSSLFRVIFSWFINRQYRAERAIAASSSPCWAASLSFSTEFVVAHLPLPDFILDIVDWTCHTTARQGMSRHRRRAMARLNMHERSKISEGLMRLLGFCSGGRSDGRPVDHPPAINNLIIFSKPRRGGAPPTGRAV
jgi:hypothetical protein